MSAIDKGVCGILRAWLTAFLITAAAVAAFAAPARAGNTGNVVVQWYTSAIVQMTLTPNYNPGYGPVKAQFGTQPTPVPQGGACNNGCNVDFGTVQAGSQYLYKYAAHVNVASNDTAGFNLYAEGTADFTDGSGNSMPLGQTLFYVPSTASGDTNTGFTAGYPFSVTSGTVSATTPPSISYTTYPLPVYSSGTGNADVYQDYEMKVPATASASNYYVWIVYTVVAK
jgi:hypothetical protein